MLRPGTKFCECPRCGAIFSNEGNFDLHRKGETNARFCADPQALRRKNGDPVLVLNEKGVWVRPGKPVSAVRVRAESTISENRTHSADSEN